MEKEDEMMTYFFSAFEQINISLWNQPYGFLSNTSMLICNSSFIYCLMATLALLVLLLFLWLQDRMEKLSLFNNLGIPFVTPHMVFGSLHALKSSKENELKVMERWIHEKGKIFGYYVGFTPYLVVADLDIAKDILIRKSANYINRPKLAIKAYPVVDTLVGLRDGRWKEVRHMLSPAFSAVKLKTMMKIMNEKIDILIALIGRVSVIDEQLEWLSTYQGLTLDIISSCAFAMTTNCLKQQNKDPFFAAVRDFLSKAMNSAVLWAQCFPFFAVLMTVINNYWSKSGKATQMIVANLKKAIASRRQNTSERKPDILQTILDSSEADFEEFSAGKSHQIKLLSDKEIIANSWVFLLGGYETTAAALSFTTYLLAKHPEVQERLYEEIKQNISPSEEHLTYENIMNLSYLDQVLNESLRMYPPVSSFLQREAAEDDVIKGYRIPKDTNIVIPIWHIHHNPLYWPDPCKFDPERFCSETKASAGRHPLTFIPFGAGPRNCIGMRFGQVAAKLSLARILLKYRFEASAETPDELALVIQTVTLLPKDKIILRAVRRETGVMKTLEAPGIAK